MPATNTTRRPGRPRSQQSLRVELNRPLRLPADSLLPWEEELVIASLAPPGASPPVREARCDHYAPFGFRTALVDDDTGEIRLVHDLHEAAVVRELFSVWLADSDAESVARTLNKRGHRTRDGRAWGKGPVLAVLDSLAVKGCQYEVPLRGDDGHHEPGWGRVSAPPIIDEGTVALVRRVREDRDPAGAPDRPTNKPQLLKGLLHCGQCGNDLQLETSGKTINGTRYRYSYYNCRSATRRGVGVCRGRRIATAALDKAVIELVRDSVCRDSRFTALATARGWLTANARDALAHLLTNSAAASRTYLLHLVALIEVFKDQVVLTPRTELRIQGKTCWIRDDCA